MNAKIIRLIARDENLHLAATQLMLRLLKKEDPDYAQIAVECHDEVQGMFMQALQQEEAWADYLFQYGSMLGLNADILKQYVRWIASRRMAAVSVQCPFSVSKSNPLPWTEKWITSTDIQEAPQETEKSSYVVGGIDSNLENNTFGGFSLD